MKVSSLSFGASSLGGVFYDLREGKDIQAVFTTIEVGMNFIDVSPYYGHYKAETVLDRAPRNIPRDRYYLSTKVRRYDKDGINTWDYSAKCAAESVYEDMERLNTDFIDLINMRDTKFVDLNQVVNEMLSTLVELREKRVTGRIGITDSQFENLKWMIDRSPNGTTESVLNFCRYCLCDDKLADFLDYSGSKKIGVINASPLSMGLLSERDVSVWHPAPKLLVDVYRKATEHCKIRNYLIEELATQFSVSNPKIATTLFSTTNPENVKENVGFIEEPVDWEFVRGVREIIGEQQRAS